MWDAYVRLACATFGGGRVYAGPYREISLSLEVV